MTHPPLKQQDLPPEGGFPGTIRYQRYLPSRGPSGLVLFSGMLGIMAYGWYWLSLTNQEKR
jgi:NADH dehydrogenase (ubiquinone) 1 alpha subcomplex subunit 13